MTAWFNIKKHHFQKDLEFLIEFTKKILMVLIITSLIYTC